MRYLPHMLVCSCALLALGALATNARANSTDLPAWQTLEFEQQALWAVARSKIELSGGPEQPGHWLLHANSSVVSNSEDVHLKLHAHSGQLISRSRLSRGKNQRLKTYDYRPQYILRQRREPGKDPAQAATQWPLTSSLEIAYPGGAPSDHVVTDAYALLLLAERFSAADTRSIEFAVQTDLNFYRVSFSRGPDTSIDVDYHLVGTGQINRTRDARTVKLEINALGQPRDKPDFSLLGLNGDIELLFDAQSGLLLQLRGTAPRIGNTQINLKSTTLREPHP